MSSAFMEHDHQWGPVEYQATTGTPFQVCALVGCGKSRDLTPR